MVGDTRNGEHHEQQQEINDGLLHGFGGMSAAVAVMSRKRDDNLSHCGNAISRM